MIGGMSLRMLSALWLCAIGPAIFMTHRYSSNRIDALVFLAGWFQASEEDRGQDS